MQDWVQAPQQGKASTQASAPGSDLTFEPECGNQNLAFAAYAANVTHADGQVNRQGRGKIA